MGDAVIVADKDKNFLVFNPAAERMFGKVHLQNAAAEWSFIRHYLAGQGTHVVRTIQFPMTRSFGWRHFNAPFRTCALRWIKDEKVLVLSAKDDGIAHVRQMSERISLVREARQSGAQLFVPNWSRLSRSACSNSLCSVTSCWFRTNGPLALCIFDRKSARRNHRVRRSYFAAETYLPMAHRC